MERLIHAINRAVSPTSLVRPMEEQHKIDLQTRQLSLYQTPTCPYCIKVWRAIQRLNLDIETRDISRNIQWRSELENEGGKIQVPCLRIEGRDGVSQWMYESADIVRHLTRISNQVERKK